jgi:hypothetical protein
MGNECCKIDDAHIITSKRVLLLADENNLVPDFLKRFLPSDVSKLGKSKSKGKQFATAPSTIVLNADDIQLIGNDTLSHSAGTEMTVSVASNEMAVFSTDGVEFKSNVTLPLPTLDNTQNDVLVRDASTGVLKRKTNLVDTSSSQTVNNKSIAIETNNVTLNGGSLSLFIDQPVKTTSTPIWPTIYTVAQVGNRKIVLYEPGGHNDHRFFGFGVNSGALRYQVEHTGADHVFYAGTSETTSNEVFRILGSGGFVMPQSSPTSSSTGTPGQVTVDANFLYVCVGTNSWKRVLLDSY